MADEIKIAVPRTTEQATALLEAFATLEGDIAAIEANRATCIAEVNARCDTAANAMIERREAIRAKLEPWWTKNAEKLTEGKRKSIELGGCMIGSRAGADALAIAGDERAIVETLKRRKWALPLLRVKISLDKVAVRKALAVAGPLKRKLLALGLSMKPGEETFFVERTEQEGTLA